MSPKILISLLLLLCWSCGFSAASRAETVAIWLFDESVDSQPGSWLQDSSGNGYHLELGEAQLVADGKFGGGLAYPEAVEKFAARRLGVQGTPLNLGNWDWTVEWWQRRDAPVMKGHVDWIYLTCDNVVQNVEKQEQWEFGFQSQSRFLGLGVWHHTRDWFSQPVRLNVLADKYDEVPRLALMHDVHPKFYAGVDPSFHHVAWVYDAGIKRLYYFEDGEGPFYVRDGTSVTPGNQIHAIYGMIGMGPLDEYPYEYDVYSETGDIALYLGGENMIGPNREMGVGINKIPKGYEFAPRSRQEQRARGVIDEMRVSRAVRYRESFSPPPSFSQRPLGPWLRLSTRRLDFISIKDRASPDSQTLTIHNVGHGSLAWSIRANQPWIRVTPDRGSVTGGEAVVVSVEVDSSGRWARLHEAELVLDTPGAASPPQTIKIGLSVQSSQESVWLFDEPIDAPHRYRLEDQSVNGLDLTLGPGGGMTPGKFGGGLDPLGGHQGQAAIRRYIDPTHLNLGHFDWTWEC
ncbi:MAG: hypothetical protein MK179_21885, partial [Pirellulaceae bacterium]|nr:hypothetical protein [Pirellulaceae bacterium]